MAPRTIQPQRAVVACAVCGRTLLQGEQPEPYLVNGERRHVCELCTVRANHQGWIREGEGPQLGHRDPRAARLPLLVRLRAARRARRLSEHDSEQARNGEPPAQGDAVVREAPVVTEPVVVAREPRHVQAVPTSEELKVGRGVELFNASEHPRTVAGVARSLGAPGVCVRASAARASVVEIVVTWELCWYRYEVDLADAGTNGVRVSGQGYELSELPAEERAANAGADEHGLLVLAD
jgi:hypothetical protein